MTVLSPCILPILPIILSGAVGGRARPYGITVGFTFSFALFTVFATLLVQSFNIDLDILRYIAAGILALMGLFLLFPKLQLKLNSLFRVPTMQNQNKHGFWGGVAIGSTLGLVWAPCAGPILAAVITLAATSQAGLGAFLIAFSYAFGTGLVMLIIILASRQLLERIKKLYAYLETIHKAFGVIVIIAALGIASGYDRKIQSYIVDKLPDGWVSFMQSFESNQNVLQELDRLQNTSTDMPKVNLNVDKPVSAPELVGIAGWINTDPIKIADFRGKVVLVDFWTYSCINCIRTLPYLKAWDEKYRDDGLVIIGVHAPEFAFERDYDNVVKAAKDFELEYPIALDNDFATWQAYSNRYWPAKYFIDKEGKIRHYHFGEGDYEKSEMVIQALLAETGVTVNESLTREADSATSFFQTPETYLGYRRQENFVNVGELVQDQPVIYQIADKISSDHWSIGGSWQMGEQILKATGADSILRFRFNAKEVYLVMGSDQPQTVDVYLDGQPIGDDQAGQDVVASKVPTVSDYRLYRLVKSEKNIKSGLLELRVPEGVELNAFTFGS